MVALMCLRNVSTGIGSTNSAGAGPASVTRVHEPPIEREPYCSEPIAEASDSRGRDTRGAHRGAYGPAGLPAGSRSLPDAAPMGCRGHRYARVLPAKHELAHERVLLLSP